MVDIGVGGKLRPYLVCQAMANDRYTVEAIKGYKGFRAIAAVDSLRRDHAVNEVNYESEYECDNESNDSECD